MRQAEARLNDDLLLPSDTHGKQEMIQSFRSSWPAVAKWCVYLVVLLAPGALIVLPILWLARLVKDRLARRRASEARQSLALDDRLERQVSQPPPAVT